MSSRNRRFLVPSLVGCLVMMACLTVSVVLLAWCWYDEYAEELTKDLRFSFSPGQQVCQFSYLRPHTAISPENVAQVQLLCDISGVTLLGWSPDSKEMIVFDRQKNIHFIDTASSVLVRSIKIGGIISGISPDGRLVVFATYEGPYSSIVRLHILDLESGKETPWARTLDDKMFNPWGFSFSANGRVFEFHNPEEMLLMDVPSGRVIATHSGINPYRADNPGAFSADGRLYAVSKKEGIEVWNLGGGRLYLLPQSVGYNKSVAFSRDGNWLVASRSSAVGFWDVATGDLTQIEKFDDSGDFALSPSGRLLLLITRQGASPGAELWEVGIHKKLGELVFRLDTSDYPMARSVAFSPDGQLMAFSQSKHNSSGSTIALAVQLWGVPRSQR